MFLRTERLFLRPPFPEDWREVFAGIAEEKTVRMMASAPWPYTPQDARDWCEGRVHSDGRICMVITLPGDSGAPVIGAIGWSPESGGQEIGYWIAPAHQRRGYATEALRGVVQTLRALGHRRLQAGHFVDNPASGRVLAAAGFRPTGAIEQTPSAGRGGASAPLLRYALDLSEAEDADLVDAPRVAA